jgi:hypothetical protein
MTMGPITAAHRTTFQQNVELALQTKRSAYRDAFTFQPNLKGRQAQIIELVGPSEAIVDGARSRDTPHIEPNVEDVYMRPRHLEWGRLIEKEDEIKNPLDVGSKYLQEGSGAMARGEDNIYRDAFFGSRLVGQDATTAQAMVLTAGFNLVPYDYVRTGAAAGSGLTYEKIVWGMAMLGANNVDMERDEFFMAVTSQQEADLYNMREYINADWTKHLVVDEGNRRIKSFFGVNFLRDQKLATNGTAKRRRCPLFCKSGMHRGEFSPLETNMDRNSGKSYRIHLYTEEWVGATRSEDGKVIAIDCLEP